MINDCPKYGTKQSLRQFVYGKTPKKRDEEKTRKEKREGERNHLLLQRRAKNPKKEEKWPKKTKINFKNDACLLTSERKTK